MIRLNCLKTQADDFDEIVGLRFFLRYHKCNKEGYFPVLKN